MRQEGVAKDLEQPRLALPTSAAEGINGGADLDFVEPAFFQYTPPACARQATGNSVRPEIDVADRGFRHRFTSSDIGELQSPARMQHSHDLFEDAAFVGTKIDDAVADDNIGPTIFDRQVLNDSPPEFHIAKAHRCRSLARAFQHFVGHIDSDDAPLGSDLLSSDKAVEAATRPQIDDPFTGPQRPLGERIADTSKRFDGALRHSGDNGLVIAQSPRQRASCMEVEGAVRINRDIPILGPYLIAEGHGINW